MCPRKIIYSIMKRAVRLDTSVPRLVNVLTTEPLKIRLLEFGHIRGNRALQNLLDMMENKRLWRTVTRILGGRAAWKARIFIQTKTRDSWSAGLVMHDFCAEVLQCRPSTFIYRQISFRLMSMNRSLFFHLARNCFLNGRLALVRNSLRFPGGRVSLSRLISQWLRCMYVHGAISFFVHPVRFG